MSVKAFPQKWIVTRVVVVFVGNDLNIDGSISPMIVTLYGFTGGEMSVSSIQKANNYNGINRIAYVSGLGDTFPLPGTRLLLNVNDFINGRINGFAQQKYIPPYYRPARVKELNGEIKNVAHISRTQNEEVSSLFSFLSRDEMKSRNKIKQKNEELSDRRPNNVTSKNTDDIKSSSVKTDHNDRPDVKVQRRRGVNKDIENCQVTQIPYKGVIESRFLRSWCEPIANSST